MITLANRLMMNMPVLNNHKYLYQLAGEHIFDGNASNYIDTKFKSTNKDFTIVFFGLISSSSKESRNKVFFSEIDHDRLSGQFGMQFQNFAVSKVFCRIVDGNKNQDISYDYTSQFEFDKHTHFAVTRKFNGAMIMYVNGEKVAEYAKTSNLYSENQKTMFLGGSPYYTGGANIGLIGKIKNFNIIDGILSASEIKSIFERG